MSDSRTPPGSGAPARDAATVLLVRDGERGLEVFMIVRHKGIEFASGAMVFPGGSVDPGDGAAALRQRVRPELRDLPERELALRVAAVREAYEECGVLLARCRGEEALVDRERLRGIDVRHAQARAEHRLDMAALAETEDLEIACDLLAPFSHWITPRLRPKRFDTRFYLAPAPDDQVALHDGTESVDSAWVVPGEVLREGDAGRCQLMFPTRLNLERLGESPDVETALAAARAREPVEVLPQMESRSDGTRRLRIPGEAGYGFTEALVDDRGVILERY